MDLYPVDILTNWNLLSNTKMSPNLNQNFVCTSCDTKISSKADLQISKKRLFDHDVIATMPDVFVLNCPGCKKTVAVWLGEKWWSIEDILKTSDKRRNGFMQVLTPGERVALWCLNSVVFKEYENTDKNLSFLEIPPEETAKLYWKEGEAVAFYTLKLKGSHYNGHQVECYCMPVVDLLFVRLHARRQGIANQIISDVISSYPDQDLGFSRPVSEPMLKVLLKFLKANIHSRTLLWETEWVGCEGYRKNIWFLLSRIFFKEMSQNSRNKKSQEPAMATIAIKTR